MKKYVCSITQQKKKHMNAIETFGYVTKANRLHLGVNKEHYYDVVS